MNPKLLSLSLLALACYPDSDTIRKSTPRSPGAPEGWAAASASTPPLVAPADPATPAPAPIWDLCCRRERPPTTAPTSAPPGARRAASARPATTRAWAAPMVCPDRMKIWCETQLTQPADNQLEPGRLQDLHPELVGPDLRRVARLRPRDLEGPELLRHRQARGRGRLLELRPVWQRRVPGRHRLRQLPAPGARRRPLRAPTRTASAAWCAAARSAWSR
jgi:hypothetical protein